MLKYFICPDGEKQEVSKCFEGCRMCERCAPLPYLKQAGDSRTWKGTPSVTMLERGYRETWLKIKKDYATNPDDSAFMILGTRGHGRLEKYVDEQELSETRLGFSGISGISDLVELQDNGEYWLIDYKTAGSYAAAKCIGVVGKDTPILDSTGQAVFYKSGAKKGKMKTRKEYSIDPEQADTSQYQKQLNCYKVMWEEANPDKPISKLKIFMIVRDGGVQMARQRGVVKKTYYIDIPILEEGFVKEWMETRKKGILDAVSGREVPGMCTPEECWDGRKCQGYCQVSELCKVYGNPYLNEGEF